MSHLRGRSGYFLAEGMTRGIYEKVGSRYVLTEYERRPNRRDNNTYYRSRSDESERSKIRGTEGIGKYRRSGSAGDGKVKRKDL